MSLDCYPLGEARSLSLNSQPISMDVAYNNDLFIAITNNCEEISIYNLRGESLEPLKVSLGSSLVLAQVVYCESGDYLACLAHDLEGRASVQTVSHWRQPESVRPQVVELEPDLKLVQLTKNSLLNSIDCCQRSGNLAACYGDEILIYRNSLAASDFITNSSAEEVKFELIFNVKLSIWALKVSLLENYLSITAVDHIQVLKLKLLTLEAHCADFGATESQSGSASFDRQGSRGESLSHELSVDQESGSNQSADDCITWNLNTKKLVKLPTLMHNTSTNLSSYHICHPLELLGPASESIACRVKASVYSDQFSENQVEAIVMLCKQFDFERDPVKAAHLQPVYLSSSDSLRRVQKTSEESNEPGSGCGKGTGKRDGSSPIKNSRRGLLKSGDKRLLLSVSCIVSTMSHCYVFGLNKKRVTRLQTITQPDLCLDVHSDLLNIYLLTPIGLQVCSSGSCDSSFHYDWSSTADLNLSFMAVDRVRILTSANYLLLVGASQKGQGYLLEWRAKPTLGELYERILHTVNRCQSISIRTNMLTYLHAMAQLALVEEPMKSRNGSQNSFGDDNKALGVDFKRDARGVDVDSMRAILRSVTLMLCKQLLQKKQTNFITNSRIDKAIKHLLDISLCDMSELMSRYLKSEPSSNFSELPAVKGSASGQQHQRLPESNSESSADESGSDCDDTSTESLPPTSLSASVSGQSELSVVSQPKGSNATQATTSSTANSQTEVARRRRQVQLGRVARENSLGELDEFRSTSSEYELIRIYLRLSKFNQTLLDYLVSKAEDERLCSKLIDCMFQHNPRLLIKCAQRYPIKTRPLPAPRANSVRLLVAKLQQLAEYDSTGINRATVLFTLAILHEALGERKKCVASLDQIKPLEQLAITMSAHFELSHSIANVVRERYPDLFNLFIGQLSRKDKQAAHKFMLASNKANEQPPADRLGSSNFLAEQDESARFGFELQDSRNFEQNGNSTQQEDEIDWYEEKLEAIGALPTGKLVELLASEESQLDKLTCRAYIEASIQLLESQFILTQLRENSC